MKKIILVLTVSIITNLSFAQEIKKTDPKLVGCWKGSEVGQQMKGLNKYWVSCRFENGISTLLFIAIKADGEVVQSQKTENGGLKTENIMSYIIMMALLIYMIMK